MAGAALFYTCSRCTYDPIVPIALIIPIVPIVSILLTHPYKNKKSPTITVDDFCISDGCAVFNNPYLTLNIILTLKT